MKRRGTKGWSLTRRQRRLGQAALVGLAVAALISLAQWAGLFASGRAGAVDYLYETGGDPGDDILIVAIDEDSQQALGDWPWTFDPYVQLFERLEGATAVGFDVLLPDPGPEGNPDTPALLEAVRQAGNVIVPLTALRLNQQSPDGLYSVDLPIQPFPALREAAADAGSVAVQPDLDGTLRQVPLLVGASGGETWESFSLRALRLHLGLGDVPASREGERVLIGDEGEIKYEVATDASGAI